MIPKDIKEMAKHDELVAELLALGGPFFYKDYQRIRNGETAGVVRGRTKKALWAFVFFGLLWGTYLVLFLLTTFKYEADLVTQLIRLLSLALYGGGAWVMYRNMRRLNSLTARIDAGEFSTD